MTKLMQFFQDQFSFWSESKIWATIFILAILVGVFFLPKFDLIVAALFLMFSASLTNGFLVGEHIAPLANLKGLGILDLITNKANKFDMGRLTGHMIFLSVLAYAFCPLWSQEIPVKSEIVGLLGVMGLNFFEASHHNDAKSVAKAKLEK